MFHMLELSRNNHAIVVPAVAGPNAEKLVSLCVDESDAAFQALEAPEHADNVLAIVGDRQGLHVRPDSLDLLLDLPGLGVDNHDSATRRRGMQNGHVELRAIH